MSGVNMQEMSIDRERKYSNGWREKKNEEENKISGSDGNMVDVFESVRQKFVSQYIMLQVSEILRCSYFFCISSGSMLAELCYTCEHFVLVSIHHRVSLFAASFSVCHLKFAFFGCCSCSFSFSFCLSISFYLSVIFLLIANQCMHLWCKSSIREVIFYLLRLNISNFLLSFTIQLDFVAVVFTLSSSAAAAISSIEKHASGSTGSITWKNNVTITSDDVCTNQIYCVSSVSLFTVTDENRLVPFI